MTGFVNSFIEVGTTSQKDKKLARRLIEMIVNDAGTPAIPDDYQFAISKDGSSVLKSELETVTNIYLPAFLLSIAKQINLYAMMRYNRLVREFMEGLIGEKYRQHDFSYTKKDNILLFFVGYHFYEIETESTGVGDYILISKRQRIRNKADVKTVIRVFEKLLIDTKGGK